MDWFSLETFVENSGLKSSVQKLVWGQTQNVIELEFLSCQKSVSLHSSKKGSTFEQSSWVFLLQSKQLSGSFSEFGKGKMDSPYLSFIFKTIFADQLELMINSFFFERSSWGVVGGGIYDKMNNYSCDSFFP